MDFSKLITKLLKKEVRFDLSNDEHLKFVKMVYNTYEVDVKIYNKMYEYYKGNSDGYLEYKIVDERSNTQINCNFIKKFIKEEVSYTLGNDITYESMSKDSEFVKDINTYTWHWREAHDSELMKYLLIFTKVYELYYLDSDARFCSKIIKPTEGYAYYDKTSEKVLFFIHSFSNKYDKKSYIDVYTDDQIYHFNNKFELLSTNKNIFGQVPVTVGELTEEGYDDSLYKDIKSLEDAFEINLSDICNEISDFRNAYLVFTGCTVDKDDIPDMKKLGVLNAKDKNSTIQWLIKNINDSFIQNTLDRYIDLMYQLSCHINHNERLQSNLSGITLESRLIALRNKCTLEIKSHKDMIKNRLIFLCRYLSVKCNKVYDCRDINVVYTPNIPRDDTALADIISKLPEGLLSYDTLRGRFSFVTDPKKEGEKAEQDIKLQFNLDDGDQNVL